MFSYNMLPLKAPGTWILKLIRIKCVVSTNNYTPMTYFFGRIQGDSLDLHAVHSLLYRQEQK